MVILNTVLKTLTPETTIIMSAAKQTKYRYNFLMNIALEEVSIKIN
jgi:hypothetical protein